jgi:regulatory protein
MRTRCLAAAYRLLALRPRSRAELSQRLRQRGFDNSTTESIIAGLQENGLLDDAAFAQFWAESRVASSPRSRMAIRMELRRKGLETGLIDETLQGTDDEENARRAATARLPALRGVDRETFTRRLGSYLQRRGFAHDLSMRTINHLWKESRSTLD